MNKKIKKIKYTRQKDMFTKKMCKISNNMIIIPQVLEKKKKQRGVVQQLILSFRILQLFWNTFRKGFN